MCAALLVCAYGALMKESLQSTDWKLKGLQMKKFISKILGIDFFFGGVGGCGNHYLKLSSSFSISSESVKKKKKSFSQVRA